MTMRIPIDPLKTILSTARTTGPATSKATKDTIRVLYNDREFGSLKNMLKGERDWQVEATMDDMLDLGKGSHGSFAENGYGANSMARLPKGTVSRGLTSNPGERAKALAGMSPKASAIAKRRAILKNMKKRK